MHAVGGGETRWDDLVEIRDELDLLGGPTATEQPGTELSVRELATRMISVSDNTATDHLMDFVGRETVEQIQTVMGHSLPSVNAPMLTTRELTILKFSGDADLAERYLAAGNEERRSILDDEISTRPFSTPTQTEVSVLQYQVSMGWFGTLGDTCRALAWLTQDDQARANPHQCTSIAQPRALARAGIQVRIRQRSRDGCLVDARRRRADLCSRRRPGE